MTGSRAMRVLDFDIENRPLSYWSPDRPSAELTAIAWCWVDDPKTLRVVLLGMETVPQMLTQFREVYEAADMVTGHYITRHDLPILNGQCLENGLPNLEPKLAQDTKTQLVKHQDLPVSQEALAEMMGVASSKYHMTQPMWREANRLTSKGLALTSKRVGDDVIQHMAMRRELLKRGLLKAPRVWRP